jgi:protein tyrosine phosphatase (PTP) superfamily phosphohydrolase (DUF442 family)
MGDVLFLWNGAIISRIDAHKVTYYQSIRLYPKKGSKSMSTKEIYNYIKVDDQLITGGQPTEEQIKASAEEGFKAVINLATLDRQYSLKDEAGLAASLGLDYTHIPVDWENPQESDFEAFDKKMNQLSGNKILIHCAANYRVTAFYSLYAQKNLGWSEEQAEAFRSQIWKGSHYPVWEAFIGKMRAKISKQK